MTLPRILPIGDIQARLETIFPAGLEMRQNLVREMAAKTVFVFLYGAMVDASDPTRCGLPAQMARSCAS